MSPIPQSPSAALKPPLTGYSRRFQRHGRRTRGLTLLLDLLFEWQERARQRHDLRSLDDRMLSDIGLSRADVEGECCKPFWRV
ncbi:MAG: DUF1127 domain-containing protein [Kiloniellales bacterium]